MSDARISAFISETTRELLESYVTAHGVRQGRVIEEALLHHLQALRELPADVVLPPRLVLTPESFEEVAALVIAAPAPTPAMRDLMAGRTVEGEPGA